MYVLDKRNTLWLRDTVRQTSLGKSAAGADLWSARRPLTSLGMSAWPYRVTTKYSYFIITMINLCPCTLWNRVQSPAGKRAPFFHLSGYVSAFCQWGGWEEWLRLVTHQSEGKATGLVITQHGLHHFHQINWSGVFPHFGVPSWSSTCERSQQQDNLGVSTLKKEGQLHSDHQTKYGIFADQFRSVFTRDREGPNRDTKLHEPANSTIDNLVVNERVKKLLLGINPNKVSGLDQIP